jgi:hypothetical protein
MSGNAPSRFANECWATNGPIVEGLGVCVHFTVTEGTLLVDVTAASWLLGRQSKKAASSPLARVEAAAWRPSFPISCRRWQGKDSEHGPLRRTMA